MRIVALLTMAVATAVSTPAWAQNCGDGACDFAADGETPCNCPADCPPGNPAPDSCCRSDALGLADCNTDPDCTCPSGTCTDSGMGNWYCSTCLAPGCAMGYDSCSCPGQMGFGCTPALDNNCCDPGEDETMTLDCLPSCGNFVCETGEQGVCVTDCPADCGTLGCEPTENECNCPADCTPDACGNGCCGPTSEDCITCAADCAMPGVVMCCGDGTCDNAAGETGVNCPGDCMCGNGVCDMNETSCNCVIDCPSPPAPPCCGNGPCEVAGGENCCVCAADCTCPGAQICEADCTCGICGNGSCDPGENCANCMEPECACPGGEVCDVGNGVCIPCGDGTCDPGAGENCTNCVADCACTPPRVCVGTGCGLCGNGSCDMADGENCLTCTADCFCEIPPDMPIEPDMRLDMGGASEPTIEPDIGVDQTIEDDVVGGGEGEAEAEAEAEGEPGNGGSGGCGCEVGGAPAATTGLLGLLWLALLRRSRTY